MGIGERLGVLRSLGAHAAQETSFDAALQVLLAGRAIAQDLELGGQVPGFTGELDALGRYLGRSCYQDVWSQGRQLIFGEPKQAAAPSR